ncbi:MAG TPA: histidine kinase dimerization/phosphoacceptor domain -containing protein [Xanthobacteraceae bacterium]|jgi:two-component sensor histidine kinase
MVSVASYHPNTREFTIEETPAGPPEPELSSDALRLRIRQQEMLADFGVLALKGTPFAELLDHAARLVAQGLNAEFAKVMRYMPEENRFLVCAGVGWGPGVVGAATVGADTASPAGYALRTGQAVISNHLEIEERFRTPELLIQHGIRRAMNVILQGDGTPFGVLEVDSRSEQEFVQSDIVFLQGVANILGMAIERQRMERDLRASLDRHQLLIKEANHRVSNSLQIVASMLHLQSSVAESSDVQHELREAASRIAAVARSHQRLYSSEQIDTLDLGAYLNDVCNDIHAALPGCELDVRVEQGVIIPTDRAIPAVLLVNELVTNAAKYAYAEGTCKVRVVLSRRGNNMVVISVSDEGAGLPEGFDLNSGRRLGMRLVSSFSKQLDGDLEIVRRDPGTEFRLTMPIKPPS